jgi:hypothetical protein
MFNSEQLIPVEPVKLRSLEQYKDPERCCSPFSTEQVVNAITMLKKPFCEKTQLAQCQLYYLERMDESTGKRYYVKECDTCKKLSFPKGDRAGHLEAFKTRFKKNKCCEECDDKCYKVMLRNLQTCSLIINSEMGKAELESMQLRRFPCVVCHKIGWGLNERAVFTRDTYYERVCEKNNVPVYSEISYTCDCLPKRKVENYTFFYEN